MGREHNTCPLTVIVHGLPHHLVLPAAMYVYDVGGCIRATVVEHIHMARNQLVVFGIEMQYLHGRRCLVKQVVKEDADALS